MPVEVEIESLFRPSSASVRQLLSDMVGGFAIPSYQRPYRWKPADIRRLFESVMTGLDRLVDDKEGVSFIGAVITVTGASNNHSTRPKDPRQVIDGQQRLSTILLMATAAHELLVRDSKRVKWPEVASDSADLAVWVNEQCGETATQLLSCLSDTKTYGDPDFKQLPKIIREVTDIWATKEDTARYISPVAHLLHEYLMAASSEKDFVPTMPSVQLLPEGVGSSKEDHELLQRRFSNIRRLMQDVSNGKEGDLAETVDLDELLRPHSTVLTSLFDGISLEQVPDLRVLATKHPRIAGLLRAMLFCRFLLERVSLTQINARNESYAFELFESLNSTGEPLTSFETFIPLVVDKETSDKYPTSISYEHISSTSKLLSERGDAVQTETSRLITSFLLADAGLKVPAKHNEQRRALGKRYQDAETVSQNRAMTRQLADTALFYFRVWRDGTLYTTPQTKSDLVLGNETLFALGFLRQINHSIAVAPLARYFSEFRADPSEATLAELETATKAVAAFSIMWRAAHGGTDGIDSRYRALMRDGVGDTVPPVARTNPEKNGAAHTVLDLPSAVDLAAGLSKMAASATSSAFNDQASWVQATKSRPIYEERELARVLLLVASHHAIPDGTTGFTKDGALSDSTDMLRAERWDNDDRLTTIEHIAPQNPRANDTTPWSSTLYADQSFVNRLGNLVLLPGEENSSLSNKSWPEKRALYAALSSADMDEATIVLLKARASGIPIDATVESNIIARRKNLPLLQAIASFDGAWDAEFVDQRTEQLLNRAYDKLISWMRPVD